MKPCPYCTKPIEDEAVKCKHCGGWLSDEADQKQKKIDQQKQLDQLLSDEKKPEISKFDPSTRYFSVNPVKLAIMSVATFGLYEIYWFYMNWQAVKVQEGKKIRPFWRAVFAVLFCYSLFKRVLASAQAKGYKTPMTPAALAILYIVFVILSDKAFYLWIISFLTFVPLIEAAKAIQFNNKQLDPNTIVRNNLNTPESVLLIAGLLLWGLTIYGFIVPEEKVADQIGETFSPQEVVDQPLQNSDSL